MDRHPVRDIAFKYGISAGSVYKYVSAMGVKRGHRTPDPKPEPQEAPEEPAADPVPEAAAIQSEIIENDKPKRKSALEKPWYLKKQTAIAK